MISTARPRVQSMSRPPDVARPPSGHEQTSPESRCPAGATARPNSTSRATARWPDRSSLREHRCQREPAAARRRALRIVGRTIGREVRRHVPERVPAAGQDVRQVHRHAAGERRSQRLTPARDPHVRRYRAPADVRRCCGRRKRDGESQIAVPDEIDDRRWFGRHRRILPNPARARRRSRESDLRRTAASRRGAASGC